MALYQRLLFVFGMLTNFKTERITGPNVNTHTKKIPVNSDQLRFSNFNKSTRDVDRNNRYTWRI